MKENRRQKSKWISVKDKMPAKHVQDYLVLREFRFLGEQAQAVAYYTGSHWLESNSATVLDDVTHWRPKPKAPKGKA